MSTVVGDVVTFTDRGVRVVGHVYGRDKTALDVLGVRCEFPPRHPPQALRWRVPVRDVNVVSLRRDEDRDAVKRGSELSLMPGTPEATRRGCACPAVGCPLHGRTLQLEEDFCCLCNLPWPGHLTEDEALGHLCPDCVEVPGG